MKGDLEKPELAIGYLLELFSVMPVHVAFVGNEIDALEVQWLRRQRMFEVFAKRQLLGFLLGLFSQYG